MCNGDNGEGGLTDPFPLGRFNRVIICVCVSVILLVNYRGDFHKDLMGMWEEETDPVMGNKDKNQRKERILNLTLDIIYLLTGQDYIVMKSLAMASHRAALTVCWKDPAGSIPHCVPSVSLRHTKRKMTRRSWTSSPTSSTC
ncbi:hypothetical protein GDO86_018842 [Hymenochirus boettgeri]|uniref:Uncharacterized protein n=1 Tax=Hymenochirus boettgeri TaxID=247094 RepID=A0A8T2ILZ6_9PIPI|nr:hypothetical protein GDO86_018842 [Hymenochirus boettgeri]